VCGAKFMRLARSDAKDGESLRCEYTTALLNDLVSSFNL
jgi:hypothetical protein